MLPLVAFCRYQLTHCRIRITCHAATNSGMRSALARLHGTGRPLVSSALVWSGVPVASPPFRRVNGGHDDMPLYVAEFQFRYNNRENADIFGTAIAGS